MKKKIIVSSIMTIVLCLSIIAGSTFALFTSEDSVNIAITAGKVKLEAFVKEGFTYSTIFNGYTSNERFENGGDATWAEKALTINRMAPGDRIDFTIKMTNTSDIDIQYRVAWTFATDGDYKLNEKLVVTGETEWAEWKVAQGQEKTTDVSVTLPMEVGNDYQEAEGKIIFTVYAVQWNGTKFIASPEDLDSVFANALPGSTITLTPDDFGTVNLGKLAEGVTLQGSAGTSVVFTTDANTVLENVTITGFDFAQDPNNKVAVLGLSISPNATINNLTIANCDFAGVGEKNGWGIKGENANATITISGCTFTDMGYPIISQGSPSAFQSLTIEGCTFENLRSWAIMPQYGNFGGELVITGNTFKNCANGLVKTGSFTEGSSFTFTNNVIENCGPHPGAGLFRVNHFDGATVVIEGNTFDGADWVPGEEAGICKK